MAERKLLSGSSGTFWGIVSGGGADLSNLSYIEVDLTDAAWTLVDPDSLVQSNTYAAGFNNVVMNTLAAGSQDYSWGAGTNHRAPRWYIPLVAEDANGNNVRITTDDTFILQVKIQKGTTTAEWDTEVVCGTCDDPTATAANLIDGLGGMMDYVATANTGYGVWTFNNKSTSINASNDVGVSTSLSSGGRGQGGVYVNLDNTGADIAGGSRNAAITYNAAADMYLMVGVGTRGIATITSGDDTDFKISYRIIKFA